jgi:hypothetical protein
MARRPFLAIIVCVALFGFVSTQRATAQPPEAQTMPPSPSPFHESLMKLVAEYRGVCWELARLEQMHDPLVKAQRDEKNLIEQQIKEMVGQEGGDAGIEKASADRALRDLIHHLRAITHRADVSAESLQATARSLEEQRETLLLQNAGEQARREAIESAIAERSAKVQDQLQNDQVILELQKSVNLRIDALKGIQNMVKAGVSPQTDITAAEAQLLQDKVQLAQRQQQVADGAGSNTLSSLNGEITALVIGQKEQQAKLDFISKRLGELTQALDLVDGLEQFKEEALRAQARYENAWQDKDWVDAEIQQTESAATQPTTAP